MIEGNLIVGQSGGPTVAINATLAGILRGFSASERSRGSKIYGMRNGIEGLLAENIVDLTPLSAEEKKLSLLSLTPASALGSCRKRLPVPSSDPSLYEKIFAILGKYGITAFLYIGGNDSMDTVEKLSAYAKEHGISISVIGVPKTIDNDLADTDHTPGFGSAAKYIACTVEEIRRDLSVYTVPAVTIVEIMGRDAGWLTAAAALPSLNGAAPDLIYFPERVFDPEAFLSSLNRLLARQSAVMVCVSEGIRFADGRYVGEGMQGATDVFGHRYLSGAAKTLEHLVREKIGCKVRSVEISLLQRCGAHLASATDLCEAENVGEAAVREAAAGNTAVMLTLERQPGEYAVNYLPKPVSEIANRVRSLPDEFINERGDFVTDACLDYLRPLILGEVTPHYENGMPKHIII